MDTNELKRLAEAATKSKWTTDGQWDVMSAESDQLNDGYVIAQFQGPDRKANAAFIAAANPATVLALIAENERLERETKRVNASWHGMKRDLDQLKAENEALRKDKDRIDALESNFWDVRYTSSPNGDAGDSSTSVEIVGSWMGEPHERVIGENYHENLRAAIDQAMLAPAYPPARPEYEYDEIPDFTPGNGNKARRRAESLGIDYDAAMGDGSSTLEPPQKCRQRLAADGKPYPRSSCEVCGQFSPKWRECDGLLAAMGKEAKP